MNKLSSKALLGIALGLSLLTSLLVYQYLKGAAVQTAHKESQPVIVAKVDIPPKTAITPEMLQVMQIPAEYIQPGAVSDQKLAIGVISREQIIAGEQITERRLLIPGKTAGFAGIIPRDKRAVTVAVSEVTGVAGFVKPGDYVDVLATFDQNAAGDIVSNLLLQNILVLASNRETEGGAGTTAEDKNKKDVIKSSTVTLAVTPEEAAKLTLTEEKGKLRLALRPYMPTDAIALTNAVTPKDLMGNRSKASPPASVPKDSPAAISPPPDRGIITIRGSKVETVPIN